MDVFRADGHLTDGALLALTQNEPMDELSRLETAEHLAFCDYCLQRYTDALAGTELLVPERSCQKAVWTRVRNRAVRLITSRYATAAAAVGLALTLLWGGAPAEFAQRAAAIRAENPDHRVMEQLNDWTGQWNDALSQALAGVSDFLGGLGRAE